MLGAGFHGSRPRRLGSVRKWRAVVEERKVRRYLLSRTHPVGRFKAAELARAGFAEPDWRALTTQLRRLAVRGAAIHGEATAYGQKYLVSGTLGRSGWPQLKVLTVSYLRRADRRDS